MNKDFKSKKIQVGFDHENQIICLVNNAYFTAYRMPRAAVQKVVVPKKAKYFNSFDRYGVYILVEDTCKQAPKFYVGKARPIVKRFRSHCGNAKDSYKQSHLNWTDVIFFVTEKTNLTDSWGGDEVEWFENRLLKEIIDVGNYDTTNEPSATFSGAVVDEDICEEQFKAMVDAVGFLGYPKLLRRGVVVADLSQQKTPEVSKEVSKEKEKKEVGDKSDYKGMTAVVVRALMGDLFSRKKITSDDIKEFTSPESHDKYKIGSASKVRLMVPYKERNEKISGGTRYYKDVFSCFGKEYALTRELYPRCIPAFLSLGNKHGLTEVDVANLCGAKSLKALSFFAAIKSGKI